MKKLGINWKITIRVRTTFLGKSEQTTKEIRNREVRLSSDLDKLENDSLL